MLSISHSLTGAFIATALPHPLVYVPLTLASHYLEDWIPHWDVGTGLSNGSRSRRTAIILELFDLALAGGLILLFWYQASPMLLVHAMVGGFVGLVPDFLEAPRNFLKWEPKFLKPINNFHGMFHHSTPHKLLGLAPQVLLWVVIAVLK